MRNFNKLMAAAAAVVSFAAVAGASQADTVGNFGMTGTGRNVKWLKVGPTGGHLFSNTTALTNLTAAGTTAVDTKSLFTFNLTGLTALSGLGSAFWLDAHVAPPTPATGTVGGTDQAQTKINGTMKLKYVSAYNTAAKNALVNSYCSGCTNLLTVTFTDAWILGGGSTATFTAFDNNPGTIVSFTSDFFNGVGLDNPGWSFGLGNATPGAGVTHVAGQSLSNFRASASGNFFGTPVPEPASWALMIVGLGGVGAMLRNRRRIAFA